MQPWQQDYLPLGSLWLSTLAALVPIVFFFVALTLLRLKGHVAAIITLVLSLAVAVLVYGMPAGSALAAAIYGFFYGLWPISWIIVSAVFLYKLTVKSGQFEVIRASVLSITADKRMQLLLIGFGFGAFLEGAAGFGAPVAITAALLVGLGFNPLYAAGLCLIANTAPVAFGALGIPTIVASQVSGLPAFEIGAMTGRQLPFLSLLLPFWLVAMMDGWKGIRETWLGCLISGGSFALTQFATSNYLGPELPDITSSLVSMICLSLYLRTLRPAAAGAGINAGTLSAPPPPAHTLGQVIYAWSPFLILTLLVTLWTLPPFKALFLPGGALAWLTFNLEVPGLHLLVERTAPIAAEPTGVPAVFRFDPLAATGSAILIAALISVWLLRLSPRLALVTFKETLIELKWPIATIGTVLGFAFVTNYSGMSSTLALLLAGSGAAFPFFSPFLGWLGVFLTGSDTSSNALFGALQSATAQQLGLSETLMVAANSSGGVTGKMISPQSISVACAATGLVGKESDLFRFTLKHSLVFTIFVGLITLLQAYVFTGMVVGR